MVLLTRQALYERVWREPVRTVAEGFELSDVGLRKICIGMDIPLPERGYWARLRSGKSVSRRALPPRGPAMPHAVNVGAAERYRSYWPRTIENLEAELAAPLPERPSFDEPIEDVRARIEKRAGTARFERNLNAGHPLIRELVAKDDARRPQPREPSWRSAYTKPLFDSGYERHRLRLLSSLFLALQKYGARPFVRGETGRELGVSIGVETVRFTLDHPNAKADRNGYWQAWPGTIDVIRLGIEGPGARAWLDTEEDRLETHLTEIVVHLIVAAELSYRASVLAGVEQAVERRRQVEQELEKAREAAERRAREARIAAEAERRSALLGMAADFRASEDIRSLVRRISEAHGGSGHTLGWQEWALGVADRLDPTLRLHFDREGQGRLRDPDWPETDAVLGPSCGEITTDAFTDDVEEDL